MVAKGKTKEQLIKEIESLSQQVLDLKKMGIRGKDSEKALQESEKQYRMLVENISDVIYSADTKGIITYISPSIKQLTGYEPEESEGRPFTQFVYPEDLPQLINNFQKKLSGDQGEPVEHRGLTKDGKIIYLRIISQPITKNGKVVGVIGLLTDITPKKQLEEELKKSEEKYRQIVEVANEGIMQLNMDSIITFVNQRMADNLGYKKDEMVGQPMAKYHFEEDLADFAERVKERKAGKSGVFERRLKRKDGSTLWLLVSVVPLKDEMGQYAGTLGLWTDITERKRVEDALKTERQRLHDILEVMPMMVCLLTADYHVAFANRAFRDAFGESHGRHCYEYCFDKKEPCDFCGTYNVLKTGKPHHWQVTTPDNAKVIDVYDFPFTEVDGLPMILELDIDITERKKVEEMLKESELKYRRIVETAMEGIIQTDKGGSITLVNQRIADMLQYTIEEMIGKNIAMLHFEEDIAAYKERRNERQKGTSGQFENRLKRKDGIAIWVYSSVAPIKDEQGQFVGTFALTTDLTDRKHLETERQRVDKLESIGTLAGGIAHDFNNILTAILGNICLAKMETNPGSELHDRLGEAEKASLRAKDLTQQLLTFSKGGAPLKKLASLAELLRDTTSFALRGSSVRCEFSIPDDLWHAEIDEGQINQVINNLVINAKQAMPSGGTVEVRAENIVLTGEQRLGQSLPLKEGNYIRIAVIDHGIGIPEEHLAKIFDPFFTTKQKGNGMGLATSFSIVRNHGGHIGIESKLGKGSTFYIYLPASTKIVTGANTENKLTTPPVKARILVMDDEETVREVASRMLKHIGCEDVEVAADGAEAVKLYSQAMKAGKPFDAVILDLTIPGGMGGKETIKKLREIDPEVKALISSGYSDDSAIAEYKDYGFKGVIGKPYTVEQLRQAVQKLIG